MTRPRFDNPSFDVDRLIGQGKLKRLYELLQRRHRRDPDPPGRARHDIARLLEHAFSDLSTHYSNVKSAAMKALIRLQKEALDFYDHVLHSSNAPDVAHLEKILRDIDAEMTNLARGVEDIAPGAVKVTGPSAGATRKPVEIPEVTGLPARLATKRRQVLESLAAFLADDIAFKNLKEFDPDVKVGVQGSIVRGTVGNPRKATFGETFNPGEFDLDVFIISDKLPKTTKVVPLAGARDRLSRRFPEALEGIKASGSGFSVKVFRSGDPLPSPFILFE